jgi:hypothetical protein
MLLLEQQPVAKHVKKELLDDITLWAVSAGRSNGNNSLRSDRVRRQPPAQAIRCQWWYHHHQHQL